MDLSNEKYKCAIQSGEGLILVDLYIRTADNKILRPVKLQKGEYVPNEAVDASDILKSRLGGSLGRSIKMGWIVVENPALPAEVEKKEVPAMDVPKMTNAGITEVAAGIVKPNQISNPISGVVTPRENSPWPKDTELPVIQLMSDKDSRTDNSMAITETSHLKKDN